MSFIQAATWTRIAREGAVIMSWNKPCLRAVRSTGSMGIWSGFGYSWLIKYERSTRFLSHTAHACLTLLLRKRKFRNQCGARPQHVPVRKTRGKNAHIDTIGANNLHNGGDHAWFLGKLYATRQTRLSRGRWHAGNGSGVLPACGGSDLHCTLLQTARTTPGDPFCKRRRGGSESARSGLGAKSGNLF